MISAALSFNYFLYLIIPAAFLLGSVPFGILFTRSRGIDIRSTGSKNIGATNVLRAAGKAPALMTLAGDLLKGALSVMLCRVIIMNLNLGDQPPEFAVTVEDLWMGIAGLAAVLGHMFSVFLSFKGGKGVATGFGVLLVYSPLVAGIMLLVWLSVAFIFRYSSLAAIIAVAAMPFMLALFKSSAIKITFGILLAVLIIFKHRANIRNIIAGTESGIGKNN
ncbi:MAG TPA: glycerol-3-phosphate 1-O-acyltransferase [Nitrospirae bacterium]|nr:glycerol-3-phosphate acyltransferase [bacterium BMS3Abin06]HDH11854.1 glycerol-3-phosphate 1-O-acyltransferase [Nitrospirota bacterium]HDZ02804.1 glycerol-3-phosphate 1-O-acyltransferase [Nitrospirota bacterium]